MDDGLADRIRESVNSPAGFGGRIVCVDPGQIVSSIAPRTAADDFVAERRNEIAPG